MTSESKTQVAERYPTCSSIPFEYVAFFLDNFAKASSPVKKRDLVKKFSRHYISRDADDIFQLYRLLLPSLDRVRGNYRMKESTLAPVLIDACIVSRKSEAAKCVLNWKKPQVERAGDLSAVAEEYLFRDFCGRLEKTLACAEYTVGALNSDLDAVAAAEKNADKAQVLKAVIMKTTSTQMKWISRIILGDLRCGMSENLLFAEFHEDAAKLYDSTMDLQKVFSQLKDRAVRLQIKDVEPGSPARAQLAAKKSSLTQVLAAMKSKEFVAEVKFDGERCQLHKIGEELKYFSRQGIDHSHRSSFEIFNTVAQRQIIKEDCVLDGELLIWNRINCCFEPFGSLRAAVKAAVEGLQGPDPIEYDDFRDTGAEKRVYQLPDLDQLEFVYAAFDILYVDGDCITHLPLSERHKHLRAAIQNAPLDGIYMRNGLRGRLIPLIPDETFLGGYCMAKKGDTLSDVAEMFNQSLAMQEEGIVVKALDSQWVMNDKGGHWVKMKPDYLFSNEIDALIIGGYYGKGKQGSKVSEYLLGILDPTQSEKRYVSFCRVGSGLSDKERSQLESVIDPLFKRLKRPPKHYRLSGHNRETADEWITDPTSSAVLEVKADIRTIPTEVFASGYSLRFPRVTRVRLDKGCEDIMTLQELNDIVRKDSGNLSSRKRGLRTPSKTPKSRKRAFTVLPHLSMTPVKPRGRGPKCLKDKIVCFSDYGTYGKEVLDLAAQELGATVYMNPSRKCDYVLGADPKNQKLELIVHYGQYDVVSVDWLMRCHEARSKFPLRPQDYLFRSLTSAEKLSDLLNGEDLGADLEPEDVQQVVECQLKQDLMKMKHQEAVDLHGRCLEELPMEDAFPESTLLASCCFYRLSCPIPPVESVPADGLSLSCHRIREKWKILQKQTAELSLESKLMWHGAQFTEALTHSTTHILIDGVCNERICTPEDFLNQISKQEHPTVDFSWLQEMLKLHRLLIVSFDWLSNQDCLGDVMDADKVYSAPPKFLQFSVASDDLGRRRAVCVDCWPWDDVLPEESLVFKTPVKRTRSQSSTSTTKQMTDTSLFSTPWKQAQKRGSAQKLPTEIISEEEEITTPRGKRTKPGTTEPRPIPTRAAKKVMKQPTEPLAKQKKPRFSVFDTIMKDDSDSDAMEVSTEAKQEKRTAQRERVMDETPLKRTRMRLRSHSPEETKESTPPPKKRVSLQEKLRALRR